jgi:hypothetical protein
MQNLPVLSLPHFGHFQVSVFVGLAPGATLAGVPVATAPAKPAVLGAEY